MKRWNPHLQSSEMVETGRAGDKIMLEKEFEMEIKVKGQWFYENQLRYKVPLFVSVIIHQPSFIPSFYFSLS